jgi:hypothetical protein
VSLKDPFSASNQTQKPNDSKRDSETKQLNHLRNFLQTQQDIFKKKSDINEVTVKKSHSYIK